MEAKLTDPTIVIILDKTYNREWTNFGLETASETESYGCYIAKHCLVLNIKFCKTTNKSFKFYPSYLMMMYLHDGIFAASCLPHYVSNWPEFVFG